jgi:hypothetical protein
MAFDLLPYPDNGGGCCRRVVDPDVTSMTAKHALATAQSVWYATRPGLLVPHKELVIYPLPINQAWHWWRNSRQDKPMKSDPPVCCRKREKVRTARMTFPDGFMVFPRAWVCSYGRDTGQCGKYTDRTINPWISSRCFFRIVNVFGEPHLTFVISFSGFLDLSLLLFPRAEIREEQRLNAIQRTGKWTQACHRFSQMAMQRENERERGETCSWRIRALRPWHSGQRGAKWLWKNSDMTAIERRSGREAGTHESSSFCIRYHPDGQNWTEKWNSPINGENPVRKWQSLAKPKNPEKTKDNGAKRGKTVRIIQQISWIKKNSHNIERKRNNKIKMMIPLIFIRDQSWYLCSQYSDQLQKEITHRRRVGAYPRSQRTRAIQYWIIASVQTFARTLRCLWSPSISLLVDFIIESSETSSLNRDFSNQRHNL